MSVRPMPGAAARDVNAARGMARRPIPGRRVMTRLVPQLPQREPID